MAGQEQDFVAEIERNRCEGDRRGHELRYDRSTGMIEEVCEGEPIGSTVPAGKEGLGFSGSNRVEGDDRE